MMTPEATYRSFMETPMGLLEIRADDVGLLAVTFLDGMPEDKAIHTNAITDQCEHELREYFVGKRREFAVSLNPQGTPFQQQVWQQLLHLPFGKTASYLDVSKSLGDHKLTRAVGSANGKNPICIIVPCHRVIGTNGTLTGYAGGIHRKKWLLQHEGVLTQGELF